MSLFTNRTLLKSKHLKPDQGSTSLERVLLRNTSPTTQARSGDAIGIPTAVLIIGQGLELEIWSRPAARFEGALALRIVT